MVKKLFGFFRLEKEFRSVRYLFIFLFLLLVASLLWKKSRLGDNARSRFITVERLVERGTWAHVAPGDTTPFPQSIDVIKVGDRIYSSKPPNYPLLMAGQAKLMRIITGLNFYDHRIDYLRMLLIVNQVLPYMLMLWVAFLFLCEFTDDKKTIWLMLLSMSIALLPFGYAPTLNNHTPAAALFFIAFYFVYKITRMAHPKWWMFASIGLVAGYACSIELTGLAIGLLLISLLIRKNIGFGFLSFICLLLPFIPEMIIYHEISGSWKPFYMQGHLYRFEGSYWTKPEGMDTLNESKWKYAFNALIGMKGLISMTPLFIPAFIGLYSLIKNNPKNFRMESLVVLAGTISVILYVIFRTRNYGGDCIGVRWFIVFMPMLMFCAWPVIKKMAASLPGFVVVLLMIGWSSIWIFDALYHEAFIRGHFQTTWLQLFG